MAGVAGAGAHQFDVPGLEVELSPLVDVSAGDAGVVDGEGSHRHVRLEVVPHVGPGIPEYSLRENLNLCLSLTLSV